MQELWSVANRFRTWVCCELQKIPPQERFVLRGDYLFIIDEKPRFIVLVDEIGAWSVSILGEKLSGFFYEVDAGCLLPVSNETIENIIQYSARTKVVTSANVLEKLLLGKVKAKIAFLSGKVEISGDLNAFLKMVSLLKKSGVRPIFNTNDSF